jgi:DNA-binding NarL/FixJ family response regulator
VGAFSEMETEVVIAARGLPDARIAEGLASSEVTVERHLANVYQKIEVRSRSEL